jgi:transaldolase
MNSVQQLHQLGQSVWLDYIRRDLLESGELEALIQANEIRGVTSNPTIFEGAIAGSELYTAKIHELVAKGHSPEQILDQIVLEDIRTACDLFADLYKDSGGTDGFVSVEVNPEFANDTGATIEEAARLWETVNRPNVMIKIPGTLEGLPAITESIANGINVNVTLIFSLDRYSQVMMAYQEGLEKRVAAGEDLRPVASVASFFVSRVDTLVDGALESVISENLLDSEKASGLLGKAAVANAKLAYEKFREFIQTGRYGQLERGGANLQRPLWASTSTKNPAYADTKYVTNLIGANTVNTLPPKTLNAFRDHGVAQATLELGVEESKRALEDLEGLGISMQDITNQLELDGVRKFAESYRNLLDTLHVKVNAVRESGLA